MKTFTRRMEYYPYSVFEGSSLKGRLQMPKALNLVTPDRLMISQLNSKRLVVTASHRLIPGGPPPSSDAKAPKHSCKRHELWVPRQPIGPNIVLGESRLGVHFPCLIKAHFSAPHNLLHFPLCLVVEPGARVACSNIGGKVKISGREAGFDVACE